MLWSQEDCNAAVKVLGRHTNLDKALLEVNRTLFPATRSSLRHAFLNKGLYTPSHYLHTKSAEAVPKEGPPKSIDSLSKDLRTQVQQLFTFTKKGAVSLEHVCNKMNLPPKKVLELVDIAETTGMKVHLSNGHLTSASLDDTGTREVVHDTHIRPVIGERQVLGVISDTHFGSRYCMRDQVRDFVQYAYDSGVRNMLHIGDLIDGCYKHGIFEVTSLAMEDQIDDLLEGLPELEGLNYHFITGNHDQTFWDKTGTNVGKNIVWKAKEKGRNDLHHWGDRSAFIRIQGAVIELWHPLGKAASYARSYNLQRHVGEYAARKPHICLVGHFHQFCHIHERGVHGIMVPTFQGSGSKFSKSLGSNQSQGGLILSWDVTDMGLIRNLAVEKRTYYEHEEPVDVFNYIDATGVTPSHYTPKPARV